MPSLTLGGNQNQGGQGGAMPQGSPGGQGNGQYCPRPDQPPQFGGSSGGGPSSGSDDGPGVAVRPSKPILPAAPSIPAPPPPRSPTRRPQNLRPALLSGDRDWVVFIECRANSLIVYPSRQEIPLSALSRDPSNPLLRAVRQMIDRKQATVAPGDMPYRPHVRFLVRPQFEQAYYQGYPSLDALAVPKSRQTLEPEDNVQEILSGW